MRMLLEHQILEVRGSPETLEKDVDICNPFPRQTYTKSRHERNYSSSLSYNVSTFDLLMNPSSKIKTYISDLPKIVKAKKTESQAMPIAANPFMMNMKGSKYSKKEAILSA